jgi:hypothetical protein
MTLSINDTQHKCHSAYMTLSKNDTQHNWRSAYMTLGINDIQHNNTLSRVPLCWVSLCWVFLCLVLLCWVLSFIGAPGRDRDRRTMSTFLWPKRFSKSVMKRSNNLQCLTLEADAVFLIVSDPSMNELWATYTHRNLCIDLSRLLTACS